MIKILTHEDEYYEYKNAVIEVGDYFEDWDYIIIPDKQLNEDDNYSIGRIADRQLLPTASLQALLVR